MEHEQNENSALRRCADVSDCCKAEVIPPDWDMAEEMGSMWKAYACYICKECHQPCRPYNCYPPEEKSWCADGMHRVVSDDLGSDDPHAKRTSFFYHPVSVNHPKHKQNERFRFARLFPRKYPKPVIK